MANGYLDLPIYAASLLYTDTITEFTPDAGVTVEGVLLKDSDVAARNVRLDGDEISFIDTSESRLLLSAFYTYDSATTLANSLKTIMNAHAADGAEHKHGGVASPDIVDFPVTTADASSWETLVALTAELTYAYAGHAFDGASVGGGVYHNAQTAFTYQLADTSPVITMYDIAGRLNDIKLRYNQHEADATGHTVGSAHTEINSDVSVYGFYSWGASTAFMGLYFSPKDDSVASLGYYANAWKEIWFNNGATDGGTIHFNGNFAGSSYIQSDATGSYLTFENFTDINLYALTRTSMIYPDVGTLVDLVNDIKTQFNKHIADATGEHILADVAHKILSPDATYDSLNSVIDIITEFLVKYPLHDNDVLLATPVYHVSQSGANALASVVNPTSRETAVTRLTDMKAKYNLHQQKGAPQRHTTGNLWPVACGACAYGDYTIGNFDYPYESIFVTKLLLDNTATDGGAIYFNNSTTSFLKSSADGLTGYFGGFTNIDMGATNLTNIGLVDGVDVSTLPGAIAAKLDSASFTDAAVTSKLITGYTSGAGTVAATDTILEAIQKLDGNVATKAVLHTSINEQTGDYTLVIGDDGKFVDMNITTTANTVTIPKNSVVAFPIGTTIAIRQKGTGVTTIAPVDGDVTINNKDGLKISGQHGVASIFKVATNTWIAFGALTT